MNALFAAACGVLVAGGVVAVVVGWTTPPAARRPGRRLVGPGGLVTTRKLVLLAAWVVAGIVAAGFSGWPLLALAVPALGFVVPYLLGRPDHRELELLEALDRWVRSLAAILPTGRSISDALRVSVRQAPGMLAGPLQLAVARLNDRWTLPQALAAMADELDSPDSDAVLAALTLSANRGGTGAQATLTALAEAIQERLKALREIDAERAKPRIVVRQVTMVTLVVLVGAFLLGGGFFDPYGTPVGQLILTVLVAAYLGSLLFLRRLTLPRARQRILRSAP